MKGKIIISTSMALVSINAMANAAQFNQDEQSKNINQSISEAINTQTSKNSSMINVDQFYVEKYEDNMEGKLATIFDKKSVKEGIGEVYGVLTHNYGKEDTTLHNKYFADIQAQLQLVANSYGTQDSTNLSDDSANVANRNAAICHGACHGACHGSRGWR